MSKRATELKNVIRQYYVNISIYRIDSRWASEFCYDRLDGRARATKKASTLNIRSSELLNF